MSVATFEMSVPFTPEEGGRALYVSGHVTLGGRWPRVRNFRAVDQRTEEDLELPDWAQDLAEEELVREAELLWRTRS